MIKELFNEVNRLKEVLDSDFVEISVRQHQIDVCFKEDNPLYLNDLNKIKHVIQEHHKFEKPYIGTLEQEIHFVIPEIQNKDETPHIFIKAIQEMAEKICQCPTLEFVISPFYVKCFLDKTGLSIGELKEYDDILGDNGTLELHNQRPYILYIYYGVHDDGE